MGRAYERLNLTELRDDADRVLLKNFPDSKFARGGEIRPAVSWWRPWTW